METLININRHTFIAKSYFLFLDGKIPPDFIFHKQYGSHWLLTLCAKGATCTFAPCIYWLQSNAKTYMRIPGKEAEEWPGYEAVSLPSPPPPPCMYVPFLHGTCPANSSSQLSNSPQELSLASLLGPKMWWLESIWMSKQETWGQMLWDIGMVRWFIFSLSTRRESSPPPAPAWSAFHSS